MLRKLSVILIALVGIFGTLSIVDGSYEKVTYVPHWYQADKQPNYNVQFPEGVEITKAQKQHTRHATGVAVDNPHPTHAENINVTIDTESLSKQEIIDMRKKIEEIKALELLRILYG